MRSVTLALCLLTDAALAVNDRHRGIERQIELQLNLRRRRFEMHDSTVHPRGPVFIPGIQRVRFSSRNSGARTIDFLHK